MSTFLQSTASRKAPTTTSTITGDILTAKALNAVHTHPSDSSTSSNGAVKKTSGPIPNGTHIHEKSSAADLSVKTKPTGNDHSSITHQHHDSSSTVDLSVNIKSTGYDGHSTHGHGHEKPLKPTDLNVYEKYQKSTSYESKTSICITEEQKHILRQGTCSLGDALSQVPWMKFRLIAEPNMDCFSSDIRLRTFIRQVTELTVSIVNKQCTDEIAILVAILVANLKSSMEVRIKLIVETIIEQIASLCLEDTMSACLNLDEIKEKVCYPKHHEHSKYGTHCDRSDNHHPHGHDNAHGGSKYHKPPNDCEC